MKLFFRLAILVPIGLCTVLLCEAASCSVSTSGVAFGQYDPFNGQMVESSGNITVTCTGTLGETVSYQIRLSTGNGTYVNRKFSSSSSSAGYNLYRDLGRSEIWGDGTSGTVIVTDSYSVVQLTPIVRTYTVYGRMNGGQTQAAASSYLENLTVTLTY